MAAAAHFRAANTKCRAFPIKGSRQLLPLPALRRLNAASIQRLPRRGVWFFGWSMYGSAVFPPERDVGESGRGKARASPFWQGE